MVDHFPLSQEGKTLQVGCGWGAAAWIGERRHQRGQAEAIGATRMGHERAIVGVCDADPRARSA